MRSAIPAAAIAILVLAACGEEKQPAAADGKQPAAAAEPKAAESRVGAPKGRAIRPGRTLLVTLSRFAANEQGKYTVPEAAELILLTPAEGAWKAETIEDRESNVFHKALPWDGGILTIGANEAKLKLWKKDGGSWKSETLWHPTFGGKHNRLRDFEIADFDGDGRPDLAIATHDQGVVAVAWNRPEGWRTEEIDREPDTFVHEIEVGDLDGDGRLEIYATPSRPNTASGIDQGGKITRYAWNGTRFERSDVALLATRHVKEIMVADADGDDRRELYAAVEAEMGEGGAIRTPVEIRRYDWRDGSFAESKVVDIQDRFCRFLVAGDLTGDGRPEIVAAAFTSGVWLIERDGEGWKKTLIDGKSGGFEHAAYLADMEGDGKPALYVADDNGGLIREYRFSGGKFDSRVIHRRLVPAQAMTWNITVADL
ncbi:MAG TPA: VCBS repeat-containing protein [Polyangia bacterium]|nr:VCBS repeat-containing protein [Polyangia bacterium]